MARCKNCNGNGHVLCPVCGGSMKDPRNPEKQCGYCNGKGHRECDACGGSGKDPFDR